MSARPPRVAVCVPIYRDHLTADELYAWRTLRERLAGVPVYLLIGEARNAAAALPLEVDASAIVCPDAFFVNAQDYSALLFSRGMYEPFSELGYDSLLIYQLDALVFGDAGELETWAAMPYDFVGAPLLTVAPQWQHGLNGGLSLRRIAPALRVLRGRAKWLDPSAYYHEFGTHEDVAWTVQVPRFFDGSFRVAPRNLAAAFAWETDPRAASELCGGRRPFGAHAWRRYDPAFYVERGLVPAEVAGLAEAV